MTTRNTAGDVAKLMKAQDAVCAIYRDVYLALKAADVSMYPSEVQAHLGWALDPPETIAYGKAVAVLKGILGHQSEDKIKLESLYNVPSGRGMSIGLLIFDELAKLGLGYRELYSFVHDQGWTN